MTGRSAILRWACVASASASLLTALAFVPTASYGNATYLGAGTVVYKQSGEQPAADEGVVLCSPHMGIGVGGGCIPFSRMQPFVLVQDVVMGTEVAFQVCIDNNGDGFCSSAVPTDPNADKRCIDWLFFSHHDDGAFHNPLGPLPTDRAGCPGAEGRGFDGWVVFLCQGVHEPQGATPHSHEATTGMIRPSPTGSGFGNFCGEIREPIIKRYVPLD